MGEVCCVVVVHALAHADVHMHVRDPRRKHTGFLHCSSTRDAPDFVNGSWATTSNAVLVVGQICLSCAIGQCAMSLPPSSS